MFCLLVLMLVVSSGKTQTYIDYQSEEWKFCNYDRVLSNFVYSTKEIRSMQYMTPELATVKSSKVWWKTSKPKPNPNDERFWKSRAKRNTGSACCETTWTCTSPLEVYYTGQTYPVYRPTDGYQVVFEGKCGAGETCGPRRCTEEDDYFTWIIIIDLNVGYYPPLRFVPMRYSNFCYCV